MRQPNPRRALLLTVGTGDMARLEDSLLSPLRKSIAAGEWSRIILLPSLVTEQYAAALQAQVGGSWLDTHPLPAAGLENDADACFAHFDHVIACLREDGFDPAAIAVDFTRGTRAMSAALVLAAVRHDLATLRYITGERDDRGGVKAGTERIFETSPAIATAQKRLDTARRFTEHGNFAGALALLDDETPNAGGWPSKLADVVPALRSALRFYAAWDRLDYRTAFDYRTAAEIVPPTAAPLSGWGRLWPTPDMASWVTKLAAPAEPADHVAMAARLRLLACDLLANGERRIRDRHYEDAVLRAYRVLELIGQRRLFSQGLDSARLPPDHAAVQALGDKLAKKGSAGFGKNKDGTLTAGRELVARLLKQLGDELAETLLNFDKQPGLPRISDRNYSVLIHGFQAVGPVDDAPLRALYRELEALLVKDAGDVAQTALMTARQADVSNRPGSA